MHVISVNVGQERPIRNGGKDGTTGIFKMPASGPVQVGPDGLAGDTIVNREHHGGPDQAVYIYGGGDYAWWAERLGQEPAPGTFGENLTISELESAGFHAGDRLHAGEVILEVTSPRGPCSTLATRMGDPNFVKRFRRSGRPGLYCRVIRGGPIAAGDPVSVEPYARNSPTILEMFEASYAKELDEATIRRFLAAPISIRARAAHEAQLRRMQDKP